MSRIRQLHIYKKHLEERYYKLIERSNDYRYEDESISDLASYKALRVLEKINRLRFLDKEELSNPLV